jgi:hypothetical protein
VRIWDGRPLTSEATAEREALGLLDFLFMKPLPQANVIDYLRSAMTIRPQARQLALSLADRYREETAPNRYHDAAWLVIRHPQANVFMCRFALAQMKAACERAPNNTHYRIALGIAQHRLGKFQKERYLEALATLTSCDQTQPATLAFLAMTEHQIGQMDQARSTLTRLRETMKGPEWASNQEAEAFLREAIELIEGKPAHPKL